MTLDEAIRTFRARGFDLLIAEAQVASAQGDEQIAGAVQNPVLSGSYGRLLGFLYGWMAFAVARAGSQAALAVGLAIFMNVALGGALERWHADSAVLGLHFNGLTLVAISAIWTVAWTSSKLKDA